MNFNQRYSNRDNFFDNRNTNSKRKEECWFCRPCRNNFPPEINWDCDDDWDDKKFGKNNKFERDYDCQEDGFYGFDREYEEFDKKDNRDNKFNKKDDRKDNNCPRRPHCHCHKRSCCGFFRIFHC